MCECIRQLWSLFIDRVEEASKNPMSGLDIIGMYVLGTVIVLPATLLGLTVYFIKKLFSREKPSE